MSVKKFCFRCLASAVFGASGFAFFATAIVAGQDRPISPKLVICGGGSLPNTVFERFRLLAGPKPSLVVIPTASRRDFDLVEIQELWRSRGFENTQVLHSVDRKMTSLPEFVTPLETATAVWFGGGSQQRIADAYLDTAVEKALHKLLRRGGVIGGTSAGAAIQSRVMIASGKTEPNISTGFDLLHGAIVDQHFLKRNRIARLLSAVRADPRLIGFGIDEGTALVIQDDKATVLGASYVLRIESRGPTINLESFHSGDTVPLVNHTEHRAVDSRE